MTTFTGNQQDILDSVILGIAHELNNPNAFIRVNASNLKKLITLARPLVSQIEQTNPEARIGPYLPSEALVKMIQLTESVLDASVRLIAIADKLKGVTSHSLKEQAQLSLRDIVGHMLANHAFLIDGIHKLDQTWDKPESSFEILGHSLQIDQALSILLTNAVDAIRERFKEATKEKGTIKIQMNHVANKMIEITITDNGCGMDSQTAEKIFVPYFTTKPQGSSDGIGLTLCQTIIQRHGGNIEVSSTKDSGSTFRVTFPQIEGSPHAE